MTTSSSSVIGIGIGIRRGVAIALVAMAGNFLEIASLSSSRCRCRCVTVGVGGPASSFGIVTFLSGAIVIAAGLSIHIHDGRVGHCSINSMTAAFVLSAKVGCVDPAVGRRRQSTKRRWISRHFRHIFFPPFPCRRVSAEDLRPWSWSKCR